MSDTTFDLSFRRTKRWGACAEYDGSLVRIYLPTTWEWMISYAAESDMDIDEYLDLLDHRLDLSFDFFIWFFTWILVHEYIHKIGIRHNAKWRSSDPP